MAARLKPSARTHTPAASYHRTKPDPSRPPSGHWFVAISDVNAEKKAVRSLEGRYMTYLPVRTIIRKVGGRRGLQAVLEPPVFPRYFFVASKGLAFDFFGLKTANGNGVAGLVRFDGAPVAVPHQVVAALMARDASGEFDDTLPKTEVEIEKSTGFSTGVKARIDDGPFRGFVGKIKALMTADEAKIIIQIFGRDQELQVPFAQLSKVA
jgi:transcription antitermination factor NusG